MSVYYFVHVKYFFVQDVRFLWITTLHSGGEWNNKDFFLSEKAAASSFDGACREHFLSSFSVR